MQTYLTTEELAERIKYDPRYIRETLKDSVFLEGVHYIRPFGRRRILFIWEAIEADLAALTPVGKTPATVIPLRAGARCVASIRARPENGLLFFDFRYQGLRCREQTTLPDTPANRRNMRRILERIEAEITLGTFDYKAYFPNSPLVQRFEDLKKGLSATPGTTVFGEFAWRWFEENSPRWKRSMRNTVKGNLTRHLIPRFGTSRVDAIKKGDILR